MARLFVAAEFRSRFSEFSVLQRRPRRKLLGTMRSVPHLLTLADLSTYQIQRLLHHAYSLKKIIKPHLLPMTVKPQQPQGKQNYLKLTRTLDSKTIALIFSKRSTRTRVAAETSAHILGGQALFLGKEDIQLGVNESMRDSAKVLSSLCQGIFARVGAHSEIEVSVHLSFRGT